MNAHRLVTWLLVAALSTQAAGCGGGPTKALPAVAASIAGAATVEGKKTSTRFTIRIPKRERHRRARYVSSATVAASVTISPASGCAECSGTFTKNYHLVASARNCRASIADTTCTFAWNLAPGSYVGSMSTYDGWNTSTNAPGGYLLSRNQHFPLSIIAGRPNAPAVTLEGAAASTSLIVVDQTLINTYDLTTPTVQIAPGATARLEAVMYDSDDEVILGAGTPAISATAESPFSVKVQDDVVAVTAPLAVRKGHVTLAVTPALCATSEPCGYVGNLESLPIVAVATGGSTVAVSNTPLFTQGKVSTYAAVEGFDDATAVAFDENGNLFVANQGSGATRPSTVSEYAPPYKSSASASITLGPTAPLRIALSPNGTLAVDNESTSQVTVYAPSGASISPAPMATFDFGNIGVSPTALTFDTANNLWVAGTSGGSGQVYEIAASTNYTSLPVVATGFTDPVSVALDAIGNLYVADNGTLEVTSYEPPSYTSAGDTVIPAGETLAQLAVANQTTLFNEGGGVVAFSGGENTTVLPDRYVSPVSTLGGPSSSPVFDQDGNLYFISTNLANYINIAYADVRYGIADYIKVCAGQATSIAVFPGQ